FSATLVAACCRAFYSVGTWCAQTPAGVGSLDFNHWLGSIWHLVFGLYAGSISLGDLVWLRGHFYARQGAHRLLCEHDGGYHHGRDGQCHNEPAQYAADLKLLMQYRVS